MVPELTPNDSDERASGKFSADLARLAEAELRVRGGHRIAELRTVPPVSVEVASSVHARNECHECGAGYQGRLHPLAHGLPVCFDCLSDYSGPFTTAVGTLGEALLALDHLRSEEPDLYRYLTAVLEMTPDLFGGSR